MKKPSLKPTSFVDTRKRNRQSLERLMGEIAGYGESQPVKRRESGSHRIDTKEEGPN